MVTSQPLRRILPGLISKRRPLRILRSKELLPHTTATCSSMPSTSIRASCISVSYRHIHFASACEDRDVLITELLDHFAQSVSEARNLHSMHLFFPIGDLQEILVVLICESQDVLNHLLEL